MNNPKIISKTAVPKYLQLAQIIIDQIENGALTLGQKLPSVNNYSNEYQMSRETVFKALNHLSEKGIVRSVDKIGYFVKDIKVDKEYKVFFMLDKFTSFKEDLYNSLINRLSDKAKVDVYFHHQNFELLSNLITQNLTNYTHFVITTYFNKNTKIKQLLNSIPPPKRIILDKYEPGLEGDFGMIYQDFESDIYHNLQENLFLVKKYKKIILVVHENAPHSSFVVKGFKKFCRDFDLNWNVDHDVIETNFGKHNLYITIDAYDRDMVKIIKLAKADHFKIGSDIGLISYNDTPIKEILEGGITVISTDFNKMGYDTAEMILSRKMSQHPNSSKIIIRNSL